MSAGIFTRLSSFMSVPVDPAAICMLQVARRAANAAANIENSTVLRKCNPLSLLASGGQASRMEMLDSRKDFRGQNLWVLSQFSQCGVDPRKHPRSRPMRLNIRHPFSHGALSRRFNEIMSTPGDLYKFSAGR